MAKWGEGDPRWIVEERADATNVNNWHWTEKNASNWSKEKLTELLKGLNIQDDEGMCEITAVTDITGEASASNRKAKLIFFYEWEIKADWSGSVLDNENKTKYKGSLTIPNLSEENDPDEIDVRVTVKSDSDAAYKLKELMRKKGTKVIQDQMAKYITDLKHEFSQGMILPSEKHAGNVKPGSPHLQANSKNTAKETLNKPVESTEKANSVGVKIHTKKFTDKQQFKCRKEELYRALTEKEMVQGFTRGPVIMEVEKGGKFRLFDGNICGEFVELVPHEKLVQRWRFQDWPPEHYSVVTMEIKETEDDTELNLTQTGIPEKDFEKTKQGWKIYYWESIRRTFGFGASLY